MVVENSISTYFIPPNEHQLSKITKELGDEDRLNHMEKLLIDWINHQPAFPKNYDKFFVRNTLRISKQSLERTKKKLENFYRSRYLYQQTNPIDEDVLTSFDTVTHLVLPNQSLNGHLLHIFKLKNPNINAFNLKALFKAIIMLVDLVMTCEHPHAGIVIIFDATNFTFQHSLKLMSADMMNFIRTLRQCYPLRVYEMHVVNGPGAIEKIVQYCKPLIDKKLHDRIHIHKTHNDLLEHFSGVNLPEDYGGKLKSINILVEEFQNIAKNNVEWYREQSTCRMEDLDAPVDTKGEFSTYYGKDGSFRKIEID